LGTPLNCRTNYNWTNPLECNQPKTSSLNPENPILTNTIRTQLMEQVPEKLDEKLINQLSALFGQIAKGEMERNRIERDPGIARKNRIIIQTLSKSNIHTHTGQT